MSLKKYHDKRDFKKTPEPKGKVVKHTDNLIFVVQKHHASRLHYDFRLEAQGVLKSWAVPKGPSLNPNDKRLAVETEDHPLDYATFEGDIPHGEYGAGHMIVWDKGIWIPKGNLAQSLKKGRLDFELRGKKLSGSWSLIRTGGLGGVQKSWLLMKRADNAAKTTGSITDQRPESVLEEPAQKKLPLKKKPAKAMKAPPKFVEPQLAQLVDKVPDGADWIHEIKYDGYRTLCRVQGKDVKFLTRSGLDWTEKYGPLADEVRALPTQNALFDGEVVWVDKLGHSDFQGLQNALSEDRYDRMIYYVFDLLHLDGEDLRDKPLRERKTMLEGLLAPVEDSRVLYSSHTEHGGVQLFQQSCRLRLEGLVSKDARQPYHSGRSPIWQKTKCSLRQEFVIGGYTESESADRPFGAILTGVYDKNKKLRYTGKIGTGFNAKTFDQLEPKFKRLERQKSPFSDFAHYEKGIHWLKPDLAAEIEFRAWTAEGIIRHGSFQGLRTDKKTKNIIAEKAAPVETTLPLLDGLDLEEEKKDEVAGIRITHPDRVVYPKKKIKKIDVVDYYEAVYPLMRPFLKDRPLSLLRCQSTSGENCFFQKHAGTRQLDSRSIDVHYKDKADNVVAAETESELIELIQAGTLEIHAWGAQGKHITKPDLIVFDLDPESKKEWKNVVECAHEIRDMLKRLELESFVKVTGGKGLHVHVPLKPQFDWDTIKEFSKSLMRVLEGEEPEKYTTNILKANRKGRIFLDYLRNGYGATAILPFSLRARENPTVAFPIKWSDVKVQLSPDDYLINDVLKRLKNYKDPWAGYWDLDQTIKVLGKARGKNIEESLGL